MKLTYLDPARSRPSLGDVALMGPFYAHLYRDPVPGHLMKTRAPLVARWVRHEQWWDSGETVVGQWWDSGGTVVGQ
eukprot:8583323-Pyramimonas_sp.AAC.2